ncbi:hypothetical protein NPIL_198561 [Nephila pilipes]|uniref:Uncharacterized protein n=1 Tax=Nephila pilipes TaxID=299642 RepID=A0A8X6PXL4_NEPPI|nr:hypothetical protein NPIL_198561 [Nephila pilipes]
MCVPSNLSLQLMYLMTEQQKWSLRKVPANLNGRHLQRMLSEGIIQSDCPKLFIGNLTNSMSCSQIAIIRLRCREIIGGTAKCAIPNCSEAAIEPDTITLQSGPSLFLCLRCV